MLEAISPNEISKLAKIKLSCSQCYESLLIKLLHKYLCNTISKIEMSSFEKVKKVSRNELSSENILEIVCLPLKELKSNQIIYCLQFCIQILLYHSYRTILPHLPLLPKILRFFSII